ncbi:Formamidopyrimidine-DNA glycosylase [Phycisphaerales bacterium]|nr:Formamidopyrimidine-DNA glycosylase [Phycisphaerales bacterium]
MPELPDISLYLDALRPRVVGRRLTRITIRSPALLRTFDPPTDAVEGRCVIAVERLGKRIVLALDGDYFLVIHLMIAGRLLWKPAGAKPTGKIDQAAFCFEPEFCGLNDGATLVLTEASKMKRASLHLIRGRDDFLALAPRGLEVLASMPADFATALTRENRTLKRAVTDPHTLDGIGNAYSDEILWAAGLSPITLTSRLTTDELSRLHAACRDTLTHWTRRLRADFGYEPESGAPTVAARFPGVGDITAFRPDFGVHGKFKKPCPRCGTKVARIVRAENEINYCPGCQTGGRVLADRSLSRLLKDDWPREAE